MIHIIVLGPVDSWFEYNNYCNSNGSNDWNETDDDDNNGNNNNEEYDNKNYDKRITVQTVTISIRGQTNGKWKIHVLLRIYRYR